MTCSSPEAAKPVFQAALPQMSSFFSFGDKFLRLLKSCWRALSSLVRGDGQGNARPPARSSAGRAPDESADRGGCSLPAAS